MDLDAQYLQLVDLNMGQPISIHSHKISYLTLPIIAMCY
jgi:hypothetical protein